MKFETEGHVEVEAESDASLEEIITQAEHEGIFTAPAPTELRIHDAKGQTVLWRKFNPDTLKDGENGKPRTTSQLILGPRF